MADDTEDSSQREPGKLQYSYVSERVSGFRVFCYNEYSMSLISKTAQWIAHPPCFGLDISDLTVKFVKIKHLRRGLEIEYYGEAALPAGVIENGEIKKSGELLTVLKKNLVDIDGRQIPDRFVVAALPEEKSFVRLLQLPRVQIHEIAAAIRWELEANIPLPIDQTYFDYEVVHGENMPSDHLDVLVTVFPRDIVESYAMVLKGAGLKPLALELESQAISRSLLADSMVGEGYIIIDLGMTRTSFILYGGGSIILTLSIDVGGKDFDATIAKTLGVSREEAISIKKEFGLDKHYRSGELLDSLIPILSALVDELKKQIWYYHDHAEHRHGAFPADIKAIYLVGGDANLIGLDKYLAVSVKKPVVIGNPFLRVYRQQDGRVPAIPKNISLKYATAIGLALRDGAS